MNENEVYSHKKTQEYGNSVSDYFESLNIDSDTTVRRGYFLNLPNNDYLDLIRKTATLIQRGPSEDIAYFDGLYDKAMAGNRVPKTTDDKIDVLHEFIKLSKDFLADNTLDDNESLAYAAIVIFNGIVLAHPFSDSNGRTARTLSYTIYNGTPSETIFKDTLSVSGGLKEDFTGWTLEGCGGFSKYDKESFNNPNQPDVIEYDSYRSKEVGLLIREWMIRAIIDKYYDSDYIKGIQKDNETNNQDGLSILDGTKFLIDIFHDCTESEREQIILDIKRLEYKEVSAGNFIRAMKTDSSFLHGTDSDTTFIEPERLVNRKDNSRNRLETNHIKNMLSYFVPNTNYDDIESIKKSVESIPLRTQLLIFLSQQVPVFDISSIK